MMDYVLGYTEDICLRDRYETMLIEEEEYADQPFDAWCTPFERIRPPEED